MSFDTNMQVRGQVGVNSLNDIKEGQNVSENQVAVFKNKLEAFQNAYSMHAQTVYKNRKVKVSEYGMEGKTGVKAFFQKTKNLCHNIAVAFRPGNENKANNAARIIEQSVTELKNAADALKPKDYDALLKTQTFGGTIRNLDDARKQIQDHLNLVKDYKDTGNFAASLNQSLTDIGNIEKNLYNGIFNSALKLADSMLNEAFDSLDKYEKKPLGNDFSRNVRTLYKAKQAISNSTFIRECQLNGNMDGALKGIDSNEILNSLYSASRIMEKRQSNELVTIGDIMAEFRRFAEAVPGLCTAQHCPGPEPDIHSVFECDRKLGQFPVVDKSTVTGIQVTDGDLSAAFLKDRVVTADGCIFLRKEWFPCKSRPSTWTGLRTSEHHIPP